MRRIETKTRFRWEKNVEETGLIYHHTGEGVYWNESVFYKFGTGEVDILEAATNELHRLCLEAGQHIIDNKRYAELGIPDIAIPAIESAWKNEPPALYGRMDLAYNGFEPPKLLEYNADTPTALLEAAVTQWDWKQDTHKSSDQFNSIHERLIEKWKELTQYCSTPLYFAHVNDPQGEDTMTATYLRDTAEQAGFKTEAIIIDDIGWDGANFVDMKNRPIKSVFKLYPWEWMIHEPFGVHALQTMDRVQWIEPIWKMLWSNKGLLPILWELNPNHPNLLPAYFDGPRNMLAWVKKPKLSREGANITIDDGVSISTPGEYGEEGFVYQALGPVFYDKNYAVLGSWVIDGQAAGIGVRESTGPITNNLSTFVPHIFE
jgi:glutathionylspermidine synthase